MSTALGTPLVELLLPCRDEEQALPEVLAAVPRGWSVLVIDNGSQDRTAERAKSGGARVVTESRAGYGAAVHAGVAASRAEVVVVCDADGSIDTAALRSLVQPVLLGEADLVCGRRVVTERGAWPWHARMGNRVLAAAVSAGTGRHLHDIAPVRVARRDMLLSLGVEDRRSGYPLETLVRAVRGGWRVLERPVGYRRRRGGRSKVSGSVIGTGRALRDFAEVLWRLRRWTPPVTRVRRPARTTGSGS